jgi:D-xylonolactonase
LPRTEIFQEERRVSAEFELFAECRCEVAECPRWNSAEQKLYWVDIPKGEIYRKPGSGSYPAERFPLGVGKIGGFVFSEDNSLLLFAAGGKVWSWSPNSAPELFTELHEAADTRFNDVAADPEGRVFCGVAPAEKGGRGSLWRMNSRGLFCCVEPEIKGMPNGMGFSPDLRYFYFTATSQKVIFRYDYERESGRVSNREELIRVPPEEGFPDGMTVGADGCLWSAQWGGGRLVCYDMSGAKIREHRFPVSKISAVTFGGPDCADLFVTTANYPWSEEDFSRHRAGSVFRLGRS